MQSGLGEYGVSCPNRARPCLAGAIPAPLSHDVAGTRWDFNLLGFRGEAELGFHAGAGVAVGGAQLITGLIP